MNLDLTQKAKKPVCTVRKSGSIDVSGYLSRLWQRCGRGSHKNGRGQKFRMRFARDYLVCDPPTRYPGSAPGGREKGEGRGGRGKGEGEGKEEGGERGERRGGGERGKGEVGEGEREWREKRGSRWEGEKEELGWVGSEGRGRGKR